jgi:hypothetical protein
MRDRTNIENPQGVVQARVAIIFSRSPATPLQKATILQSSRDAWA